MDEKNIKLNIYLREFSNHLLSEGFSPSNIKLIVDSQLDNILLDAHNEFIICRKKRVYKEG